MDMKFYFRSWFFVSISLCVLQFVSTFVEVSDQVFKSKFQSGIIAAFGDFTSDKRVDLFLLTDSGKTLKIIVAHDTLPFYRESTLTCNYNFPGSAEIIGVVPGDFNGDNNMDVVLSIKAKSSDVVKVKILWGYKTSIDCAESEENDYISMKGQPLALDYNGDAVVDLLGEDEHGARSIWTFKNKTTKKLDFFGHSSLPPFKYPHSNAFVDLNGDLNADIFITNEKKFEQWINEKGKFVLKKSIDPPSVARYHQVNFCDYDADGVLNAIVPVCKSEDCSDSAIYGLKDDKWQVLGSGFVHENVAWNFAVPQTDDELTKSMQQPTLRIADINMDGFPDILTIMYSEQDKKLTSAIFVMMNTQSNYDSKMRTFNISTRINVENASLAAFHDIFEDGRMDLLVNTMSSLKDVKLHAFRYTVYYDAYFLKVIVLTGECKKYCPRDKTSYGENVPGACVRINSITSDTLERYGYMPLLPQSAYFALNLPYMIFGLGQTPNFVETLRIGLPSINNNTTPQSEWKQIIPNSQVVIVPYPLDSPSSWYVKLFVTTSRLIIITSGALIGTCFLIILIILFLHWREKREDRREKQQDAHRFHFNAM